MAIEKGINPFSWPASGTLATKDYYCVNFASDGEIQLANSTRGAFCIGVLQNDPAAVDRGAMVQTLVGSITKVQASTTRGVAIAIGDGIYSSTLGKASPASTGGTAYVWGRAVEALGASTEQIISVMITHEGITSTL